MLKELKEEVLKANIDLYKSGLVIHTWGNVSGIDRVDSYLLDKHYKRKHGKDAYYGQKKQGD